MNCNFKSSNETNFKLKTYETSFKSHRPPIFYIVHLLRLYIQIYRRFSIHCYDNLRLVSKMNRLQTSDEKYVDLFDMLLSFGVKTCYRTFHKNICATYYLCNVVDAWGGVEPRPKPRFRLAVLSGSRFLQIIHVNLYMTPPQHQSLGP